ncbi:carboxylating nicotinate-nucleotide diphosphorylase [Kiritimatiella glycovorans]|uniref:Probable nicotinate-nucleotide pyrophosphorylase [carboxylating] n=1 Tax=Kiritimatiella glycovorans TaxID=1307763 RepID=A0A0G3EH10_9BACT|nr:carboxylating nicotinate-nucleotide diphosphorylase [Kiritimatiella glycovorans]AKJ64707.1 Nicotinate-nucleotide pyrophosphorylase (carboxylating) [Kiritimatiella glycovorans]
MTTGGILQLSGIGEAEALIEAALREDLGPDRLDATTLALVRGDRTARARLVTRAPCTVAGGPVAAAVFECVDPDTRVRTLIEDGRQAGAGEAVLEIKGRAGSLLTAERTALNFIQRLTGVATVTRRFVDAVQGTQARILDTRKTTPGYRALEKYAVRCGGGANHRMGLFDAVLIKDNHLHYRASCGDTPVADAVRDARAAFPHLTIEVEVDTLDQLDEALTAEPDWVLLDNMDPGTLREAVRRCAGRCSTEASGTMTLDRVAEVAAAGVDAISVGALTHSATAVDLALDFAED